MKDDGMEQEPLEVTERDPIHWAFNELIIQVFQMMMEEMGVHETLEIVRPKMHYSGKAMARNFAGRFGVQDSLEAIAYAPFCGRGLTWGGKGRLTLYERGATLEFLECPLSHGPPELCVISHFLAGGICEEIDSDYEITYTQHMTQGDQICLGICKKKNGIGNDYDQLGKRMRVLENLDMSDEERDALSLNIEVSCLKMFLECLVGRIPEDRAVQILNPIFAAVGKRAGQKISMKIVEDDNVGPSILTALTWADMLGTDARLIEIGNDAFELRLKGCLCRDSIPGVCVLMESFLAGMISALNPRIGMQFLRSTNDPDSYCRIFLTLRPLSHQNDNDPLSTLKMRLAKGEISEEEYIRKRMIILE